MDIGDILKNFPGQIPADVGKEGKAIQAQVLDFLSNKMKGRTRFVTTEAVNVEGLLRYLNANQGRILSWNVVQDFHIQKFILLTEEIPHA